MIVNEGRALMFANEKQKVLSERGREFIGGYVYNS